MMEDFRVTGPTPHLTTPVPVEHQPATIHEQSSSYSHPCRTLDLNLRLGDPIEGRVHPHEHHQQLISHQHHHHHQSVGLLQDHQHHQHHHQVLSPSTYEHQHQHQHHQSLQHHHHNPNSPHPDQKQSLPLPQIHHHHQHHPPHHLGASNSSYGLHPSDCQPTFSPLRSPHTAVSLSSHPHSHDSPSLYSPSSFLSQAHHSSTPTTASDAAHSSPTWSHSQRSQVSDALHARNRSISLSTPNSIKCGSGLEGNRPYPMGKMLNLPYRLDSPEQLGAPPRLDGYPLQLGLSNLYPSYAVPPPLPLPQNQTIYPHHQPSRFSPAQYPPPQQRRVLQPVNSNDQQPLNQSDGSNPYLSRAPTPTVNNSSGTRSNYEDLSTNLSQDRNHHPESYTSVQGHSHNNRHPEAAMGLKRKGHPGHDESGALPSPKSKKPSPALETHSSQISSSSSAGHDAGPHRMTTVLCLHASVAQKSYGQEKRFLCPPPLVRITGPYRQLEKAHRPVLSMTILNEEGRKHLCQTAFIGENDSNVHFKSLHISGAAKKAKHVTLELSLHPPYLVEPPIGRNQGPDIEELAKPFATFRSEDCNIISKPSKKTAKARNTQSCIFNGSTICLFNRINSQTVRTKYLCVHDGMLAAKAAQWSAFIIKVVRRAEDPGADGTPPVATRTLLSSSIPGADRTVTYGSEVELIDFVTGVSSGPLVVRKVEKNKVQKDATGPVSQMQKLAFCQIDRRDGSALYISALEGPSTMETSPGLSTTKLGVSPPDPIVKDENQGQPSGMAPGIEQSAPICSATARLQVLQLQPPRAILPPEERGGMTLDQIDDSVAWTVIGVDLPITPFPALISWPKVDLRAMTMNLRIRGFFDVETRPMEVWLGPIGPLSLTVLETGGLAPGVAGGMGSELGGVHRDSQGVSVGLEIPSPIERVGMRRFEGSQGISSAREETSLLVRLPPLETIYWTLHRTCLPQRALVVLDETNRTMSELVGRDAKDNNEEVEEDGNGSTTGATSNKNHIPTLPIALIRADRISYVMGHSICLSEVIGDDYKENIHKYNSNYQSNLGDKEGSQDEQRKRLCVFKVI